MDGDATDEKPAHSHTARAPGADLDDTSDTVKAVDNNTHHKHKNSAPASDEIMFTTDTDARGIPEQITWTASEFVAHDKPAGWYVLSTLGALVIAGFIWLVGRDLVPVVAVFIGIELLVYYASRKPAQQTYRLDSIGLTIGSRHLPFSTFRSFAVIPDGAFLSIELTPLKRFAMYTTVYIDPHEENQIIDFLSNYLPLEDRQESLTDNLMRRLHF